MAKSGIIFVPYPATGNPNEGERRLQLMRKNCSQPGISAKRPGYTTASIHGKRFKVPSSAIVYRGPWVLSLPSLKRIAYYSLFFDKVYVSSYVAVPDNTSETNEILESAGMLIEAEVLEGFSLNYHSYWTEICRSFDVPHIPLFHIRAEDTVRDRAGVQHASGARTKIYGQNQETLAAVPLLATVHDLTDLEYVRLLKQIRTRLGAVRLGTQHPLYRRIWPAMTAHITRSLEYLDAYYPAEAKLMRKARSRIPITLIDYAYYVNLSLHWMMIFNGAALSFHPEEAALYAYRIERGGKAPEWLNVPQALEAQFSIPFFPERDEISVEAILAVRKLRELKEWREYMKTYARRVARKGRPIRPRGMQTEFSRDLWKRALKVLTPAVSSSGKLTSAAFNTGVGIAAMLIPPIAALGFIGPAKEVYDSVTTDPILMFAVKARQILLTR